MNDGLLECHLVNSSLVNSHSPLFFLYRGKYRFERSDGSTFETPIPPFALDSREEDTPDSSGTT